jgi:hypothetical protein
MLYLIIFHVSLFLVVSFPTANLRLNIEVWLTMGTHTTHVVKGKFFFVILVSTKSPVIILSVGERRKRCNGCANNCYSKELKASPTSLEK